MKKIFSVAGIAFIVLLTAWLTHYFYLRHIYVVTDDAYQMADIVSVSTQDTSGKIVKLFKREYETVSKGSPLFKIDDSIYRKNVNALNATVESLKAKRDGLLQRLERLKETLPAAVRANEEKLKALNSELQQLNYKESIERTNYETSVKTAESELAAAKQGVKAANASLNHWKNQYKRYKGLYGRRIISLEQFEEVESAYKDALHKFELAKANLQAAEDALKSAKSLENRVEIVKKQEKEAVDRMGALQAQLKISRANLKQIGELTSAIHQLEGRIKSTEEQLGKAKILLSHTVVNSPIDGFIAKKWQEEGNFISPGLPVYSIYNPKSFYILAWVEEDKVKDIKVNSVVKAELEACKQTFKGKVSSIGKSAGSIFSLIPRDTSQGEYTRVTQRVPVKIKLEKVPLRCIKPGTNVTVYIKKR